MNNSFSLNIALKKLIGTNSDTSLSFWIKTINLAISFQNQSIAQSIFTPPIATLNVNLQSVFTISICNKIFRLMFVRGDISTTTKWEICIKGWNWFFPQFLHQVEQTSIQLPHIGIMLQFDGNMSYAICWLDRFCE